MKVYVAGKTQDIANVRQVQHLAREMGHRITFDWTAIVEANGGDVNEVDVSKEKRAEYALRDLYGVQYADVLIAVGHPNLHGTLWECGMAAILDKPIWLYKWERCSRRSVFEDLPTVKLFSHHFALATALETASKVGPRL